jgi:hypothetical protein
MNDINSNPDGVPLTAGQWPAQEPTAPLSAVASVKMMLTLADRQALRDLGYSDEAISHMTPDAGAEILARRDVAPKSKGQSENGTGPAPPDVTPKSNRSLPKEAGILAVRELLEIAQAARYLHRIAELLIEAGFYVSVHHPSEWIDGKTGKTKEGVPGFAFTDLGGALNYALAVPQDSSLAKSHFKNVYLAMSGEIAPGTVTDTKTYAKRFHENVGACNCLWADVDVKPNDGNAYETKAELSKAFQQFLLVSHLPFPNLIVRSGRGGMHLCWSTRQKRMASRSTLHAPPTSAGCCASPARGISRPIPPAGDARL